MPEAQFIASLPETFVPLQVPEESNLALVARDRPHELIRLRELQAEAHEALGSLMERMETLSIPQADAEARRHIEAFADHPFGFQVEQVLSNQVLRRLLEDDHAEPLAVAYHTTVLLRNEHPDAAVMVPALERLARVWPEEAHRQAVEQTLANAHWWLERNPCDACMGEDAQAEAATDLRMRRTYEIGAAVPRLERMREAPSMAVR